MAIVTSMLKSMFNTLDDETKEQKPRASVRREGKNQFSPILFADIMSWFSVATSAGMQPSYSAGITIVCQTFSFEMGTEKLIVQ